MTSEKNKTQPYREKYKCHDILGVNVKEGNFLEIHFFSKLFEHLDEI
jgi:hypothetical protein